MTIERDISGDGMGSLPVREEMDSVDVAHARAASTTLDVYYVTVATKTDAREDLAKFFIEGDALRYLDRLARGRFKSPVVEGRREEAMAQHPAHRGAVA